MIKIHVHIANECKFIDDRVFVKIILPTTPRVGETLYLKEEHFRELERQARQDLNIAIDYSPKWFYGHSFDCDDPKTENLKDLGFEDAINISSVAYYPDEDVVHIEIDSL